MTYKGKDSLKKKKVISGIHRFAETKLRGTLSSEDSLKPEPAVGPWGPGALAASAQGSLLSRPLSSPAAALTVPATMGPALLRRRANNDPGGVCATRDPAACSAAKNCA